MTDPRPHEDEIAPDDAQALSRATGGVPGSGSGGSGGSGAPGDADSTTGTGPNQEFVGRVAGQDEGYAAEQGGERRAAYEAEDGGAP